MLANSFLLLPVVVDNFISVIEKPGAKHVFKSTFKNSIDSCISLEKLEKIKNLPCLIIWGEKDALIPKEHGNKFKQILVNDKLFLIPDTGNLPFV